MLARGSRATLIRYADDFIIGFEREDDARRVIEVLGKRLGCRRHRHRSVREQHAALSRRLRGHFNYFGVSGNFRSLLLLVASTRRAWYKWLHRRSQRKRLKGAPGGSRRPHELAHRGGGEERG
ncbi:MAG TPA: hypothetical protein VEK15_17495 [Vicinamibacteria bacterium]|nr:hypothetical protein [Vicinamibacteria bacterium]